MGAAAPWSVKGIDPRAREVAKELARRSGMTLGEWLNRIILEDDVPEEIASEEQITARFSRAPFETPPAPMSAPSATPKPEERRAESQPTDDLGRIAQALDRLTDRIEASETRTGLAIAGVEHSVRHAMARIETAEREQIAVATRFDAAAERLADEQARAADRLRQIETEGPRSLEAIRALEARVVSAEAAGPDPAELIEDVVARLGERLADAEARTTQSLESLRGSLAELDERLQASGGVRVEFEQRLESLAHDLTRRIEDARGEIAGRLADGASGEVEARLDQLASDLAAAEQRSARAIEAMGREVLTMADALSRRVRSAEQRSAEAIEQVGGEIARIAGAVESRLARTDQLHAEALERLGAEIARITERLTERVLQSERRAAQAIDDVGEQVAKVTERIEQRHERASSDLAERIRASEARTAKLLDEAQARLAAFAPHPAVDEDAAEPETAPASTYAPAAPTPAADGALPPIFGAELFSRAEPLALPALDPTNPAFGAEDFEAVEGFVPLDEPVEETLAPAPETPATAPEARPQLSTREVIEQARAAARAAAASATRTATVQGGERRARPARGHGLLAGLKPHRAPSTWQTALMVAGGAAFLSVGAAGVVLMEGPGAPRQPEQAQPLEIPPRAAMAVADVAPGPGESAVVPNGDSAAAGYLDAVRGVERKEAGALAKLKTIADGGYAPAQAYLARLYETGQAGVSVNLAEARRWTERAAEAGDPAAMHNLALFYFRGEGGPPDAATAARWFRKAAQQGVVDSQYNLGLLYQSGSGVPKDLAQAYKWFSLAAVAGDAEAHAAAAGLEEKIPAMKRSAMDAEVASFEPQAAAPARAASPSATEAQQILSRLGYYKGKANVADPKALKLAVAAYQRDQGIAATGSLDPATVSRLSVFAR